jgi:acetyltransferase-like isoleucine patch superfamily enzyme
LLSYLKSLTYNAFPVTANQRSTIMPNRPNIHTAQIKHVSFGKNVTVVEPVNLYGCSIGDDAFVGPFVEIQADANIGAKTRIQSHSFICEFVTIGDDCFIGHGVMFINDRFENGGPAPRDRSHLVPTKIGDQVSIGSNATILPVNICDRVVIGAGAVVTKDIDQPGIYAGNPARKLRDC